MRTYIGSSCVHTVVISYSKQLLYNNLIVDATPVLYLTVMLDL